jgi:hypothetical protein
MNETLKNYVVGALTVALLISLGFNVQPDDTHFSRALGVSKHCDHFSSSGLTCYPYASSNSGSKYSSSGWEAIDFSSRSIPLDSRTNIGTLWNCNQASCNRIK